MDTKTIKLNFSDKEIYIIDTKNCSYCTIELLCKKCINSLEKLAKNGDKVAMYNLAICYVEGEVMEKNSEKAFYWYQKAAENGVKEAMYNLGKCYLIGEGTENNLEKAFYWV